MSFLLCCLSWRLFFNVVLLGLLFCPMLFPFWTLSRIAGLVLCRSLLSCVPFLNRFRANQSSEGESDLRRSADNWRAWIHALWIQTAAGEEMRRYSATRFGSFRAYSFSHVFPVLLFVSLFSPFVSVALLHVLAFGKLCTLVFCIVAVSSSLILLRLPNCFPFCCVASCPRLCESFLTFCESVLMCVVDIMSLLASCTFCLLFFLTLDSTSCGNFIPFSSWSFLLLQFTLCPYLFVCGFFLSSCWRKSSFVLFFCLCANLFWRFTNLRSDVEILLLPLFPVAPRFFLFFVFSIVFIHTDITWCGGITEARRIIALASAFDVPIIPHGSSVYSYHLQVSASSLLVCSN